ncbi:phosphate regulon transcriptional regulator PhoB [Salinisphaera sp.]|uniref:phosphate regulon transcriptional regulator PhoB n=1 Tax=Salinisphaera sp. TaxID=1914330 RepID=UPI000C411180|nr:phosphate regulon transcriptional regulator PhoB [Salinisphaera sp.]MBS62813.1 phosphate regulon transcriptional regulatory protein PhoB [Salinisphaera sp.]
MQHKHVLIVEDEAPIRDMIRFALERADFAVSEAEDAQAARLAMAERRPDLVLLDWMLPGVSGAEFARELRRDELTAQLPVIMVTARVDADDRVRGLNLGADDYITKPFSSSELVARVRAVLRRSLPGGEDETLELDGLVLDAASQRVAAGDSPVKLGPTEYRLLRFFMSNPERVYSREQMLDRVWGQNVFVEERTVDVHIRRLRKALAPFGFDHFIQTVRGSGYRFSSKAI